MLNYKNANKVYSDLLFSENQADFGPGFDRFDFEEYVAPSGYDREKCIEICDGVVDILSALFNVSGRHMRSAKRQSASVVRLRQIGIYLAHVSLGLNMEMVASGFAKSKSTVVHACRIVEDMRDDEDFEQIINRVERIVYVAFGAR